MATYDNVSNDLARQVKQLRSQVEDLMEERVSPVLSDAADRASKAARRARKYTETQADYVTDQVRDQPLIAIGVAAAVGYLLGRLTK